MFRFNDLSIKTKVITIVWLGISSALLVALANFILFDRTAIKNSMHDELLILSRITAARSNAALAFLDVRKATENLEQLAIHDSIQSACIYNNLNQLFAFFHRHSESSLNCPTNLQPSKPLNQDNQLQILEKIYNKKLTLGYILVTSDLSPIEKRMANWLMLSGYMLLIATIVVIIMSRRLQTSILTPIKKLTTVMDHVKHNHDLTLRVPRHGKDELGQLTDTFNDMLNIIETSNKDIATVYNALVDKSTRAEETAAELETRNQKIKDLLSSAAHDLRQPLQAMSIFLEMLQLQEASTAQKNLMDKMDQSMLNLRTMFAEILDVSKLEHQLQTSEKQTLSLSQLIKKLQLEFSAVALSKGLSLRTHITDVQLLTETSILERVIRNLVSNALNYTVKGGVLIAVRTRKQGIYLEIWDTGQGISEKNRARIFEKFVQDDYHYTTPDNLPATINNQHKGYGLGLAIVKNFIERLGFSITLNSKLGRGSCFRIHIPASAIVKKSNFALTQIESAPVTPPPAEVIASNKSNDDPTPSTQELLQATHLILIDDNHAIRADMQSFLESLGLQVSAFAGIDDCHAYFEEGDYTDPDIIISDYQLDNNITGDQVIQMIRETIGVDITAFIVTGNTSPDIEAEIVAKGYSFFSKPLSVARLKNAILEQISQ